MKENQRGVQRREVIEFYATYDRRKKGVSAIDDFAIWPWDDSEGIRRKLVEHGLKEHVLPAYESWTFCQLNVADILECAIVNRIFRGEPQALSQLVLRGKLKEWFPKGAPEWWRQLGNGAELDSNSALILRPALRNESPAKWYVEDGSGRILALLQRILRYGETSRTAWAYIGDTTDERSQFIIDHPELNSPQVRQ